MSAVKKIWLAVAVMGIITLIYAFLTLQAGVHKLKQLDSTTNQLHVKEQ